MPACPRSLAAGSENNNGQKGSADLKVRRTSDDTGAGTKPRRPSGEKVPSITKFGHTLVESSQQVKAPTRHHSGHSYKTKESTTTSAFVGKR